MVILPIPSGHYTSLDADKGKIYFLQSPNTGSAETQATLKYYDVDKREVKTILANIDDFQLSVNRSKILLHRDNSWAIVKGEENQKFEKPLRITEMKMLVDPVQEWQLKTVPGRRAIARRSPVEAAAPALDSDLPSR